MSTYLEKKFIPEDWISQAEAARVRRVSRQAIAKLVQSGRLRSIKVGGHVLVNREDAETFEPGKPGRPKKDD